MSYIKKVAQLGCLLGLFSCASSTPPDSVESQSAVNAAASQSLQNELTTYKNAIIALNENELEKAEKLFIEMSILQPEIAGSWANLALINAKKGDVKEAQRYVEIALSKNPNMAQSWNLSGYLALQDGKIKSAQQHYQRAIEINPSYALAHYNLALLYDIYLQDVANAVQHYEQYLSHSTEKDQKTKDWLEGLKASLEANS